MALPKFEPHTQALCEHPVQHGAVWSLVTNCRLWILMLWSQPTCPSGKYRTKPQCFAISCKTLNFLVSGRCFSTQLMHTTHAHKAEYKKVSLPAIDPKTPLRKKVELGMKTAFARSRICHTWKVPDMFTYYIHTWMQTTLCIWVCLKHRYTSMWISYILVLVKKLTIHHSPVDRMGYDHRQLSSRRPCPKPKYPRRANQNPPLCVAWSLRTFYPALRIYWLGSDMNMGH